MSAIRVLNEAAARIRILSVKAIERAQSGHPSSCASVAEILSVLFFHTMRYTNRCYKRPCNDRLVLSKGHAAPALYAASALADIISAGDLQNLRIFGSDLEGHPTPRLPFVDVATGSLGQGLSCAAGMAYVGKYFDKASFRVYCITGDGEMAEGSIWEALNFASTYKLDNLCLIVDVNRLGQAGLTNLGHDYETYCRRISSFGFETLIVDGHCVEELMNAFNTAICTGDKPFAIIARTVKGKDLLDIENQEDWHGKPLGPAKAKDVLRSLDCQLQIPGCVAPVQCNTPTDDAPEFSLYHIDLLIPPNYKIGDMVSTRTGFANAAVKLGRANNRVIVLDADTRNSTYSEEFLKAHPCRFIECFIAEQNMIGVAIGAECRQRTVVFCAGLAAFLTRAFDQLRMGAISKSNINVVGSHCGISVGKDGPSQMALEDIAMFRTLPGSTIFYPADPVATEKAVEMAANTKGITYIRTTRTPTPVIYPNDMTFKIGKAIILTNSNCAKVLVVAAGITLHEALDAYCKLKEENIIINVLDPFTIKPLDDYTIRFAAKQSRNRVLVVEDHYYEGGLGEAVKSSFADERDVAVWHLAVPKVPRSGTTSLLLDYYCISSANIQKTVKKMVSCGV